MHYNVTAESHHYVYMVFINNKIKSNDVRKAFENFGPLQAFDISYKYPLEVTPPLGKAYQKSKKQVPVMTGIARGIYKNVADANKAFDKLPDYIKGKKWEAPGNKSVPIMQDKNSRDESTYFQKSDVEYGYYDEEDDRNLEDAEILVDKLSYESKLDLLDYIKNSLNEE